MLSLLVGLLRLYARSEALPDCWQLHRKARDHRFCWRRITACRVEETGGLGLKPSAVSILYSCGRALCGDPAGRRVDSDDRGELRQRRSGDRIPSSESRTVREPYSKIRIDGDRQRLVTADRCGFMKSL